MKKPIASCALLFVLAAATAGCSSLSTRAGSRTAAEDQPDRDFEAQVANGTLRIAPPPAPPAAVGFAGGGTAHFYVLDMGQADSMLVVGPEPARKTLLIDAGELGGTSRKGCDHVRDRVVALTGKAHVDYFVLTHYHLDHAGAPRTVSSNGKVSQGGGLFCLLDGSPNFFSIGTLIDPGDDEAPFEPTRQASHAMILSSLSAWITNGTLEKRLPADFTPGLIDLGAGIKVEMVSADGRVFDGDPGALKKAADTNPGLYRVGREASPNDFSIGLEISVGNFELFTAGDLSGAPGEFPYPLFSNNGFGQLYTNIESHMVSHWGSTGRESNVEVYRANHHGSANSSTTDLANALKPELVIYSCGGRHGHPDPAIVKRFESLGSDQMVTTRVDKESWPNAIFPPRYGNGWDNPAGEIQIDVPVSGTTYTVSTATQAFEYPILSDQTEANQ